MPSFTPAAQLRSAEISANFYNESLAEATAKATQLINQYQTPKEGIQKQLIDYLTNRKDERFIFGDDLYEISDRSQYIAQFLKAVQYNNTAAQKELLKDSEIKRFKGFFSHRLYDTLAAYRASLETSSSGPTA